MQTTQDYSVMIHNPPVDLTDVEEYYKFFKKFGGDVVSITVAKKNGILIHTIAQREVHKAKVISLEGAAELARQKGLTPIVLTEQVLAPVLTQY